MKSIELHTAAVDNANRRLDAGAIATVGDKPDEIASARARDLVARKAAVAVPPAQSADDRAQ